MIRSGSLVVMLLLVVLTGKAQDLFDLEHSQAYASHLFRGGQYTYAAREYERIHFMDPTDTLAALRMVQAYRLSQDFDHALERNLAMHGHDASLLPRPFAREFGLGLMAAGRPVDASAFLLGDNQLPSPEAAELMLGLHILSADWDRARGTLDTLKPCITPVCQGLQYIALEGSELRYKSPGLALAMSAVVPGSGKVYTGQWGDGLIALAFVGTNAWQSYRGFNNKGFDNPYGYIFGALALAFYAGDLYGSFQAAKRYNHRLDEPLRDQAYHLLFDTPQ